ncbi:Copper resistance protein D [compost metagenome]
MSIRFLPRALKQNDPDIISNFEKQYEPIGMPALLLLIVTGIWMAYDFGLKVNHWFSFLSGIGMVISIKLILLLLTFAFAIHARFFVIPKLSKHNLKEMAVHIVAVTVIGVAMLILGSTIRYGGIH